MVLAASLIVVVALLSLQQTAATRCRRPRNLRHGHYEYENRANRGHTYLPTGFVMRVVCDDDTTRVGNEYIMCESNGRWSEKPICRAQVVCYPPAPPPNGYVRVRGRTAGSVAIYRCNPGFQLYGQTGTTCNGTTQDWMGHTPACFRPPSCVVPYDLPDNMTVTLRAGTGLRVDELYTEDSVLQYTCVTGYALSRVVNITCQDETWIHDDAIPECIKIVCPPPTLQPIANGYSDIEDRNYTIGEVVQYRCNHGYLIKGKSWQVCQGDVGVSGTWTDKIPICKVVQCPDPGSSHLDGIGAIIITPPSRGLGAVMHLQCPSTRTLLGSSRRVCQPNGRWNGTLTSCSHDDFYCPALGNPFHGSKVGRITYRLNSVIRFQCDPDLDKDGNRVYEMIGSEERTCTSSGEWTGEMPECLARDEFDDFGEVTRIMGHTFDAIAIDGSNLATRNESNAAGSRRKRSIDLQSTNGIDIFFAFDSSGSVGLTNFNRGKEFAKLLVQKVFVSLQPGGARVGALYYSSQSNIAFHVNEYADTESVTNAIDNLVNYLGNGTNLPAAFGNIINDMIPAANDDRQARRNRRVLFIITDGMNNMGGLTEAKARQLKEEHHFAIHCIGISYDVSKEALAKLASLPHREHIFFLQDYEQLSYAVNNITKTERDYSVCGMAGTSSNGIQGRIVGGNAVASGTWPWQVALYKNDEFFCGGSLIGRRWVLTAAHCLDDTDNVNIEVYLGLTDRNDDLNTAKSQRFNNIRPIIHESYDKDAENYRYDIALLKLERNATLNTYVRTVCLPPDENINPSRAGKLMTPVPTNIAVATGWGKTSRGNEGNPVNLQEVRLPLVDDEACRQMFTRHTGDDSWFHRDSQFCAGDGQGRQDSCSGDSGGPLVVRRSKSSRRFTQVGIISSGVKCALQDTYGLYSRLTGLVSWVKNKMSSDA